jgi:hypothetical protein
MSKPIRRCPDCGDRLLTWRRTEAVCPSCDTFSPADAYRPALVRRIGAELTPAASGSPPTAAEPNRGAGRPPLAFPCVTR